MPARANDWFEHPERFRSPAKLREHLGRERVDPFYSWSSEHGDHVTAAAYGLMLKVSEQKLTISVGGRYDERLRRLTSATLLMSAASAGRAIVGTWLHDLPRLCPRGAQAFFQLARSGDLERPTSNAIAYVQEFLDAADRDLAEPVVREVRDLERAYREEAQKLERAGLQLPGDNEDF